MGGGLILHLDFYLRYDGWRTVETEAYNERTKNRIEEMIKRRKKAKVDKTFTNGPGSVAQALRIKKMESPKEIAGGARICVDYADAGASLTGRFRSI
ncbi:MAG: hypothetical protein JJU12_04410 [Chlamydiales bacterium]|nr:hypothetical protein [Chlamydiales bacterium]